MIYDNDFAKIIFTEAQLRARIQEVAKEINDYYHQEDLIVVGLLKGSFYFCSYLAQYLDGYVTLDFIKCTSYSGTASTGNVKIDLDLSTDIHGKNVLLVEDIIDSGITLKCITNVLSTRGAKSVKIVTLLDKKEGRLVDIHPNWNCFICPNEFVAGFGLDYDQEYRNVPYIGVMSEEAIKRRKQTKEK